MYDDGKSESSDWVTRNGWGFCTAKNNRFSCTRRFHYHPESQVERNRLTLLNNVGSVIYSYNLLYLGTGAVILIKKMAKTYIEENNLHFGLDYMVIFGTFKYEEIFRKLNYENSEYWELEDFTFNKSKAPKYIYAISFTYKNHKVFSYVKGNEKEIIPTSDAITVYGVAFKLMSIEEIRYFLEWYFTLRHMKRFDICIDIEDSIENVLRKFKVLKQKWWKIFGKGWVLETQYFGNPRKSINKRSVIRVYNKIVDVKSKNKASLHMDYIEKKDVTRVELEVRAELAKNIVYFQLFEEETLKWIFKNYLRKHTKIFDKIADEKITLYRDPSKKIRSEAHRIYYEKMYRRVFIWYARNILALGVCPVRLLIWQNMILQETIDILWEDIVSPIRDEEDSLYISYMWEWKI